MLALMLACAVTPDDSAPQPDSDTGAVLVPISGLCDDSTILQPDGEVVYAQICWTIPSGLRECRASSWIFTDDSTVQFECSSVEHGEWSALVLR